MRIVDIDGFGKVVFKKSRRARKLIVSVKPLDKTIQVSVPCYVSFKEAQKSISSDTAWLERYLSRVEKMGRQHNALYKNPIELTRNKAADYLKDRLERLAVKCGFVYKKVFFREQKTRWGSCSHKNNISLNVKLAKLPIALIDYVIVHELVHTQIKNHKKVFWETLDRFLGDAKVLDKELKKYCLALL